MEKRNRVKENLIDYLIKNKQLNILMATSITINHHENLKAKPLFPQTILCLGQLAI
jgi:hypothetical protein